MNKLYLFFISVVGTITKNIMSRLANYQQHLQKLKKGFILIIYPRKSVRYANYRDKNIQKVVDSL